MFCLRWSNKKDLSASNNYLKLNNCTFSSTNGGLIVFNGSSSYAYLASCTGFNSTTWTIIVWMYYTGSGVIMQIGRSPTDADTEAQLIPSQFWDWDNSKGGACFNNVNPTTTPSTLVYFQFAFVKNSTLGYFYLNGAANGTPTASQNAAYSLNDFCIGKDYRDNVSYLNGYIGRMFIYNYSMTSAEIATNFTNYRAFYNI